MGGGEYAACWRGCSRGGLWSGRIDGSIDLTDGLYALTTSLYTIIFPFFDVL